MFARVFVFLAAVTAVSGCREKPDEHVHEIGVESLVRGLTVARAFDGKLVKVRIDPGWYVVAGREIRVHGTVPHTTPIVTFVLHPTATPPDPKRQVYVIGRCGAADHDGVRRSARADYCVTVRDCLAAQP